MLGGDGGRPPERGYPSPPCRRGKQLPGRAGANQLGGQREREGGLGVVRPSALGLAKVRGVIRGRKTGRSGS